jgi:hypothetical protein
MTPTRIYWDSKTHRSDPCWVAASGDYEYELPGDVGADPDSQDQALVSSAQSRGCRGPFWIERTSAPDASRLCALCRRAIPE